MTTQAFNDALQVNRAVIEDIRQRAARCHADVNQHYDKKHPYSFHLNMVADNAIKYGAEVCASADDVIPMIFGAYFHDSIEDARLTYNDVMRLALEYMNKQQAYVATEIVYALTNDKGRTRAERAGEHYYFGIRQTPYAPFLKLCDRMANGAYSVRCSNESNAHMKSVYHTEMPHFLESITVGGEDMNDCRLTLPASMVNDLKELFV